MPYTATPTELPGVLVLEPKAFADARGSFYESFNGREFERVTGLRREFVQDNHVVSVPGALRGLHFQLKHPQGKLVRVAVGEIWDVAIDARRSSPHFGKHVAVRLSAENRKQLWAPEGFVHGYLALTQCEVIYKATDYWAPDDEFIVAWNDATLNIPWPLTGAPILSPKDAGGLTFADCELPT